MSHSPEENHTTLPEPITLRSTPIEPGEGWSVFGIQEEIDATRYLLYIVGEDLPQA